MIEQAIYSILTNDATVSGLVSSRVYPNKVPQGVSLPAVTYQQISGRREHTMAESIGMVESRFQINCWDDSYSGTRTLSNAVRNVLDSITSGTYSSTFIYTAFLDNEGDMPEVAEGADQLTVYGKRLDFIIWFKE